MKIFKASTLTTIPVKHQELISYLQYYLAFVRGDIFVLVDSILTYGERVENHILLADTKVN